MSLPAEQDKAFRSLFPNYIPAKRLQNLRSWLQENVPLAFRRDIICCIEMIRSKISNTYFDMETSLPPDYARFLPDFTDYFLQTLQLAVDFAGDTKLYIPPEHRKCKEPEREEGNLLSSNSNK